MVQDDKICLMAIQDVNVLTWAMLNKKQKTTKLKNLYKGNFNLLCQTAQTHGEFIFFFF